MRSTNCLSANFLLLNKAKSEDIIFGHKSPTDPNYDLSFLSPSLESIVCNFGVFMHSTLKMDTHINHGSLSGNLF